MRVGSALVCIEQLSAGDGVCAAGKAQREQPFVSDSQEVGFGLVPEFLHPCAHIVPKDGAIR